MTCDWCDRTDKIQKYEIKARQQLVFACPTHRHLAALYVDGENDRGFKSHKGGRRKFDKVVES